MGSKRTKLANQKLLVEVETNDTGTNMGDGAQYGSFPKSGLEDREWMFSTTFMPRSTKIEMVIHGQKCRPFRSRLSLCKYVLVEIISTCMKGK